MDSNPKHWTYNLSEYVFEVRNLNFDWVLTWYGILGLVLVFGGGLGLTFWMNKKAAREGRPNKVAALAQTSLVTALVIFVALFGLKKAGIDWGLRWYSTMYVLGYVQVYLVFLWWMRRRQVMMTQFMLDSLIAYLFIGMLAGARLFYVFIYNWSFYKDHPLDMLKVWHGGLSFHGGIAGVIVAVILYCRQYRVPFWHLADKLALVTPFGIGIGRLGNFLNGGELYGRVIESNVPWAIIFPQGGPMPRHPSQIYQSLGEGWGLLLTLFLISRRRWQEGTIAAAFVFFYGLYRFPVEYFREADEQLKYYFNNTLTMGQILCILTMFAGIVVFAITRNSTVEGSETWRKRIDDFLEKRRAIEEAPEVKKA